MVLKAELENSLRDWKKIKEEVDRARLRVASAQATLEELARSLDAAAMRVTNSAGVGRSVTERFFRIDDAIFEVKYAGLETVNIRLVNPEV